MKIILEEKDKEKIRKRWIKKVTKEISNLDFQCGKPILITLKVDVKNSWDKK